MPKWYFPSNNNASISGINDAGIATFESNVYESLVRESIQNSLDAKAANSDAPVRVEFKFLKIPKEWIPGRDSLEMALEQCQKAEGLDEKTNNFLRHALCLLKAPCVNVLKISDYNTTGLTGSTDGKRGSAWSKLIKENGSNNKQGGAGGSFGIGKSAYYASSVFRTVFFSSLNENGEKSYIGESRLISFDLPDGKLSQGVGFYSPDENLLAFQELASFDREAARTESGTDVYIIGNRILLFNSEKLKHILIDAIIENFMVSLVKKLLVVEVNGIRIDAVYVQDYYEQKYSESESGTLADNLKSAMEYYRILTNADSKTDSVPLDSSKYGQAFGFKNDECQLYLRKGDDLNRKILITRKTGMKLFEQTHLSASINFSGVLYISGNTMNNLFRKMESPAHNKWEANQQDSDYQTQFDAYKQLREYLRSTINELYQDKVGDEFDAFNVDQFLPDNLDDSANGNGAEPGLPPETKKVKSKLKIVKPSRKLDTMKNPLATESGTVGKGDSTSGKETSQVACNGNEYGQEAVSNGHGTGFGSRIGTSTDQAMLFESQSESLPTAGRKADRINYKEKENIQTRIICLDKSSGLYSVRIHTPNKAKHVKLNFSIAGEQSDYDLNILSAKLKCASTATKIENQTGNHIVITDVSKGDILILIIRVDFSNFCMMEVKYNESKK